MFFGFLNFFILYLSLWWPVFFRQIWRAGPAAVCEFFLIWKNCALIFFFFFHRNVANFATTKFLWAIVENRGRAMTRASFASPEIFFIFFSLSLEILNSFFFQPVSEENERQDSLFRALEGTWKNYVLQVFAQSRDPARFSHFFTWRLCKNVKEFLQFFRFFLGIFTVFLKITIFFVFSLDSHGLLCVYLSKFVVCAFLVLFRRLLLQDLRSAVIFNFLI